MELYQLIAIAIRKELKRQGKNQRILSEESGISEREISGYFSGKKPFSIKRVGKLIAPLGIDFSDAMKIAIDEVYGFEGADALNRHERENEALRNENKKLIEMLYEMTMKQKGHDKKNA